VGITSLIVDPWTTFFDISFIHPPCGTISIDALWVLPSLCWCGSHLLAQAFLLSVIQSACLQTSLVAMENVFAPTSALPSTTTRSRASQLSIFSHGGSINYACSSHYAS
jgi:hypothetical protein